MSFLDELSARLGVPYRLARLPQGCRAYLMNGIAVINDSLTPEQANWSYCHEVAHSMLQHQAELPIDDAEEREQELAANRLAAQILLPEGEFRPLAHFSLLALKQTFPQASHEVLAKRRLTYRPGLLTIFDNGRLTARLAPEGWNIPGQFFPLEQEAMKACLSKKEEVVMESEGMRIEATYVDEGRGVVRVILFVEGEEW